MCFQHIGNSFPAVLYLFYWQSFYFCPSLLSVSVPTVLVMLNYISTVSGGQLTLFRPELEGFHFHTLKHTYTTNLLSNGAQPKDVQELLGHSDVSTTMNVYAHATREATRDSAKLLDKVVGMS